MLKWILKLMKINKETNSENENKNLLKCPNCKNTEWISGPSGGSFGNIQCVNCDQKFNDMGPFGLQKIK